MSPALFFLPRTASPVSTSSIGLYKREQVSLGRAAEIAGMTTPAFLTELARRQIPVNYSADDLKADMEILKKLS